MRTTVAQAAELEYNRIIKFVFWPGSSYRIIGE